MKNKTAVLSAVFPVVLPFVSNLVKSLSEQTIKDFDWVVLNDSINTGLLQKQIEGSFAYKNIPVAGMKPSQNRWFGIQHCIAFGYSTIIFQDADDFMSANRIENALHLLEKSRVVFHGLSLVDENGAMYKDNIWSERLTSGHIITADFLRDKNCIGLGNTAIRTDAISKEMDIPHDVIAVDWFIFYQLLQEGAAMYSDKALVYYRQYPANAAGIGYLNEERIRKAVTVKQQHYASLVKRFPELQREQEKLHLFQNLILNQPDQLRDYITKNKEKGMTSFWWEETNYSL